MKLSKASTKMQCSALNKSNLPLYNSGLKEKENVNSLISAQENQWKILAPQIREETKMNEKLKELIISFQMVEILGTSTGNWLISFIHGFFSLAGFMVLRAFQTALLHLNPEPNAICHVLSPFFILPFPSA